MFYEVMFYKHHAQCDLLFKSSCTKDVQTKFFDRLQKDRRVVHRVTTNDNEG